MRLKWKYFHLSFAAVWIVAAVFLACNIALLGNDTERAGKQWGVSERKEREFVMELGQLRKQIEWKASRGYVEQKVRTMGLPLHNRELERSQLTQRRSQRSLRQSDEELLARQP